MNDPARILEHKPHEFTIGSRWLKAGEKVRNSNQHLLLEIHDAGMPPKDRTNARLKVGMQARAAKLDELSQCMGIPLPCLADKSRTFLLRAVHALYITQT